MKLYEKIRILRKKKGWSQDELAQKVGIHITHVSRLENGHYQPSLDVVKKFIEIFEVSADYLLNDETDNFEVNIKDKSLAERIRMVDTLADEDRKALAQVIDSMLTKKKVLDLLTKKDELVPSNR